MKNLLFCLLFTISLMAQPREFEFTKDGFTEFVVTDVSGKTAPELYKKTIDWVSFYYNNPKEVLKAQIENDYIRIEGVSKNLICFNSLMNLCYLTRYSIEISFKDGKYKFELQNLEYYVEPNQYGSGGWRNYQLSNMKEYFKDNGEAKGLYRKNIPQITAYFNSLNHSLKDFISSESIPSKKNDW